MTPYYSDESATSDECGDCALEPDHFGPCAWICSECGGSGHCTAGCDEGLVGEE